jgi:hypothetical protein
LEITTLGVQAKTPVPVFQLLVSVAGNENGAITGIDQFPKLPTATVGTEPEVSAPIFQVHVSVAGDQDTCVAAIFVTMPSTLGRRQAVSEV